MFDVKMKSNDEILVVLDNIKDTINKQSNFHLEYLFNCIEMLSNQLNYYISKEPLKIFRNKHLIWEQKVDVLNDRIYRKYNMLEDIIDKM